MTWMRSAAALPLLLMLLTGCTASPPDPTGSPSASSAPAESTPPASGSPAPSASAPGRPVATGIDTSTWMPYTSERYGFTTAHPPDWIVTPSQRDWTPADSAQFDNDAQEWFFDGADILVTAWAAPYTGEATPTALQTWIERYCVESENLACATVGERAVRLCSGREDCDPGLLVPFDSDVQAFFTSAQHPGRIIAVASWRPASYQVVASGSTSREILDAFLSTMDVWPQP